MYRYIVVTPETFDTHNAAVAAAVGAHLWVNSIDDLQMVNGVHYMHLPEQSWHLYPSALHTLPGPELVDATRPLPVRWVARLFANAAPSIVPANTALPALQPDEERVPASSIGELLALGEGRFGIASPAVVQQITDSRAAGLLHPDHAYVIEHNGTRVTRIRLAYATEPAHLAVVYWPYRWASQNPEINSDLLWWWYVRCEERALQGHEAPWDLDLQAA